MPYGDESDANGFPATGWGSWRQWKRRHLKAYQADRSTFLTNCTPYRSCLSDCLRCDAALEEWAGRHDSHRNKSAPRTILYAPAEAVARLAILGEALPDA